MRAQRKVIGIIGGQGPASTIDFYLRIIQNYQQLFGARYISEYPHMIIHSVPTPTLVKRVENEQRTFTLIRNAVKALEQDGADFIIITCVSLQYFVDRLQQLVRIPILKMTPILAEYAKQKGYTSVGVLATYATIKNKIVEQDLLQRKIQYILPDTTDQRTLEQIILRIIGGTNTKKDVASLQTIVSHLHTKGAEAILLACTEFPLILKQQDCTIPLIDCNAIYTEEIARYSQKKENVRYNKRNENH